MLRPVSDPAQAWVHHQQYLKQCTQWQFSGVISVQQGQQLQNAHITWVQSGRHFVITLSGPLGLDAISLSGQPGTVTLRKDHREYHAQSPQTLMQDLLGWSVPIAGAVYWVRGLPMPHQAKQYQLNQYGLLAELQQQDWTVSFPQYMAVKADGLPAKLIMQRSGLKVFLVIDHWYL